MMKIPDTWRDATEDVCPRPRVGLVYGREPDEPIEEVEPVKKNPRPQCNYTPILHRFALQEGWSGECEMLRQLRRVYGTESRIACVLEVSHMTVHRGFARCEMYAKRGRPFQK